MRRTGVRLAVAGAAMAVLLGCQKLKNDEPPAPTGPSEVSTSSGGGGSTPVLGSVPANPSPTPSPTPEGSEPPAEDPAPSSGPCRLPPSSPASPVCTDASPLLLAEVEAALDAVTERFPGLFDFNDTRCSNCYLVRDPSRYIDEVIKQLSRQGVCASGGLEELGIKSSNDFSEQYDILLASDHMRRGAGSYRGVCRPATF